MRRLRTSKYHFSWKKWENSFPFFSDSVQMFFYYVLSHFLQVEGGTSGWEGECGILTHELKFARQAHVPNKLRPHTWIVSSLKIYKQNTICTICTKLHLHQRIHRPPEFLNIHIDSIHIHLYKISSNKTFFTYYTASFTTLSNALINVRILHEFYTSSPLLIYLVMQREPKLEKRFL